MFSSCIPSFNNMDLTAFLIPSDVVRSAVSSDEKQAYKDYVGILPFTTIGVDIY